jgi:hypothetical protein
MKTYAVILLCVVFGAASCNHELEKGDPDTDGIKGESFTFYSDRNLFDQSFLRRSAGGNNEFSIVKVEAVKDYFPNGNDALVVTTSIGTTCEGDFSVIWDGSIMESFPRRINLLLQWNGSCNSSPSSSEEVLVLNINDLIGDEELSENSIFSVINGAVSHDGNDQEVSFN